MLFQIKFLSHWHLFQILEAFTNNLLVKSKGDGLLNNMTSLTKFIFPDFSNSTLVSPKKNNQNMSVYIQKLKFLS